jgi:hypothetical protein
MHIRSIQGKTMTTKFRAESATGGCAFSFQAILKSFVILSTAILLAGMATVSGAQDYPTKPIRMIIPLTPGSGADIAGRIIARHLGEAL